MDNATAISTPSESYFALAWCSESDGFNSDALIETRLPQELTEINKQYKINVLIITRVKGEC
jgi:predicted TIM-barrel enzyme